MSDINDIDKMQARLSDALDMVEVYQVQADPENAEKAARVASTMQRMYVDALRAQDDTDADRQPMLIFWEASMTDDFMTKYLGPSPVCIPSTPH